VGKSVANSEAQLRACEFLLSKQCSDGGWGESYLSCQDKAKPNLLLFRLVFTVHVCCGSEADSCFVIALALHQEGGPPEVSLLYRTSLLTRWHAVSVLLVLSEVRHALPSLCEKGRPELNAL